MARQMHAFNCLFSHPLSAIRDEFKATVNELKRLNQVFTGQR